MKSRLQGHVDAIKRHLQKAAMARDAYTREKERKFAQIAYTRLKAECESMTDKQVERDSPEALAICRDGIQELESR